MGFTCGSEVSGDTLAGLIAAVQAHAMGHHGYTEEQVSDPEKIAEWQGAIKSSSRPGQIRTPRSEV